MERYKDYGLQGVSSPLQVGKSGGTIEWDSPHGRFVFKDASGVRTTIEVSAPVYDHDVATKTYVDASINAVFPKDPVVAASTSPVTISNPLANFDGYIVSEGDRVLLKDQTIASENGIYIWSASGLTRSSDADNLSPGNELKPGTSVLVINGNTQGGDGYMITSPSVGSINLGVDSITWTKVSQQKSFVPTDGLTMVGNEIRVGVDNYTTEIRNDAIAVKSDATAGTFLISGGTGQQPIWGAIDLNDPNSITDILPVEHGGLGQDISGWIADRIILSDGSGNIKALDKGANNTVLKVEFGALKFDKIVMTTDTEGTLESAQGGTGYQNYNDGDLLYADNNTLVKLPAGTTNQYLRIGSNGLPDWDNLLLSGTTISGVLAQDHGGTGIQSYSPYDIIVADSGGTLGKVNVGVAGQILTVGPSGNIIWGGIDLNNPTSSTGILPVDRGGTGKFSYQQGSLLVGDSNQSLSALSKGAVGNFLQATNTGLAYAKVDISDTTNVEGVLAVDQGGTGETTYGYGELLYGSGVNASLTKLPIGPADRLLALDGTQTLNWSQIDITNTSLITGTLTSNRGGTGFSSYAKGDLLTADNGGTIIKLNIGTYGQVLTVDNGEPTWGGINLSQAQSTTGILPFDRGGLGFNTGNDGDLLQISATNTINRLAPSNSDDGSEVIAGVSGKFEKTTTTNLRDLQSRIQKSIGQSGGLIGTVPAYARIIAVRCDVYSAYSKANASNPVTISLGDFNDNNAYTERLVSTGDIDANYTNMWYFAMNHMYTQQTDIHAQVVNSASGQADIIIEYVIEEPNTMDNHF